ncbi:MAG: hypothetical protein AAFX07_00575 [Pseudomonadota bacterium]
MNFKDILQFTFRRERRVPRGIARRWKQAYSDDPELAVDLINLGNVFVLRPEFLEGGEIRPDPIDPVRLAYEQGQRDLALQLLALMRVSPYDLNQLVGEPHEHS